MSNVKCVGFDEKINIGGPDVNVKCQAKEDEIKMSDTFLQRQVRVAHVNFLQLEFSFVLYIYNIYFAARNV